MCEVGRLLPKKTKLQEKSNHESTRYLQHVIMEFYPEYFILKIPTNKKEMDKKFFLEQPNKKMSQG